MKKSTILLQTFGFILFHSIFKNFTELLFLSFFHLAPGAPAGSTHGEHRGVPAVAAARLGGEFSGEKGVDVPREIWDRDGSCKKLKTSHFLTSCNFNLGPIQRPTFHLKKLKLQESMGVPFLFDLCLFPQSNRALCGQSLQT